MDADDVVKPARGDDFPNAIPNQLFIEWIDGDGDIHFLAGGQSLTPGDWNHVAFVLTATDAQLWVAGGNTPYTYTLLDSISGADFAGPSGEVLINSAGTWTVGRGMFNGGIADWSDALIDEVRIYSRALTAAEIQADMTTPVAPPATDTQPPTAPAGLAQTASTETSATVSVTFSLR